MDTLQQLNSIWVNLAAIVVLALIGLYVISSVVANWRIATVSERALAGERELLRERVEQIHAARNFDRQQNELSWNGVRKFRVADKVEEADQVCSFYLKPHDERPLPPFHPGQYLTFKLDLPSARKQATRCYSLSDSANEEYYRVSIKRNPPPRDEKKADIGKSSSNFFHDHVEQGTILDVQAPSGDYFMDTTRETPVVLIGGGIGITPVLSMLNTIVRTNSRREAYFFVGVRNSREHMFKEQIEEIGRGHDNVHIHVCYSNPDEGDVLDKDYQHLGRVGVDLFKEVLPSNNFDYYFCGPPPMMNSVYEGLEGWGVPDEHIHFEAFGPATVKRVSEGHEPPAAMPAAAGTIEITFSQSDVTLSWDPAAGSLLEFAEANDIEMDSGCRAGSCGTCVTAMREGDVEYLKPPNNHPDKGTCLTCIAVPKSNLTLDA